MLELEHNGYYPLTQEHLRLYVPARPGIFMLAVRLVSGEHRTFYTSQSENLYRSLRLIAREEWSQVPSLAQEYLGQFQCYFTYFLVARAEQREEVEKMLAQTSDPPHSLRIINCN